jgi:hypothetical protein
MTKTGFFFRTHFWNPDAERMYRLQCEAAGQPVILLADETNGPVDCGGNIQKISYRLADFQRMGLPIYPNAERCMWQCGDYALYTALLATDVDHLVLMEYDSIPAIDLLDVMKRVIEGNVDLVAHQFAHAGPRWVWNESTIQWYQREVDSQFDLSKMRQCNFPFVIVSRRFALDLFARRLEMARFRRSRSLEVWVHCEPFIATEVDRLGYRAAPLSDFGDVTECTTNFPVYGPRVTTLNQRWRHPVLFDERYIVKLAGFVRSAKRDWTANDLRDLVVTSQNWDLLREGLIRYDSERWASFFERDNFEAVSPSDVDGN